MQKRCNTISTALIEKPAHWDETQPFDWMICSCQLDKSSGYRKVGVVWLVHFCCWVLDFFLTFRCNKTGCWTWSILQQYWMRNFDSATICPIAHYMLGDGGRLLREDPGQCPVCDQSTQDPISYPYGAQKKVLVMFQPILSQLR